ncbi:hypothetical protein LY56_03393 [Roseinatronobacter thiooxidans]|uniref:Uncharacterized protein n=1 Tax=Roseinatronobacter thiooxidans TaxID=121821 RepID=A0A2W7PKE6_9RHOB|nr:hypothetical protein LY56_03393 [Roseinatronobacter thiooxidans]
MVEFVDADVIEGVRREAAQVADPPDGLDRGEKDVGAFVLLCAIEAAEPGLGPDPAERGHRLGQDLIPMGHEQHLGEGTAVEGGQPGLAQPCGQHDQTCPVPGGARGGQRRQCSALDRVRFWRLGRGLVHDDPLCQIGQGRALPPGGIDGDPVLGQRAGLGMGPAIIKGPRHNIGSAFGSSIRHRWSAQFGTGSNCR